MINKQYRGRGAGVLPVREQEPDIKIELSDRERVKAMSEAIQVAFKIEHDECQPDLCAGECKECGFRRDK